MPLQSRLRAEASQTSDCQHAILDEVSFPPGVRASIINNKVCLDRFTVVVFLCFFYFTDIHVSKIVKPITDRGLMELVAFSLKLNSSWKFSRRRLGNGLQW